MSPLLSSLQRIYIWSDGCSAQFRCFTFVLPTHLHPDKDIEWNYNESHHGKGPIEGVDETIKNKVFQEGLSSGIRKGYRQQSERFCHARKPPNSIYHEVIHSKEGDIRRTGWYRECTVYQRHTRCSQS